jgi:hypothetical protein
MTGSSDQTDNEKSTKPKGDIHRIRFGKTEISIPTIAFGLMLVGILIPTAKYSFSLVDPSPSELLIATCMALFSGVVFLWILDATSLLRFRSEFVSKSIYGAAISSVLGTSVAVYQEAFSDRKFPYEGRWEIQIKYDKKLVANKSLILMYSSVSETYWGYSDFNPIKDKDNLSASWLKVDEYDNKTGEIHISYYGSDGTKSLINSNLQIRRNGKLLVQKQGNTMQEVKLYRPKH